MINAGQLGMGQARAIAGINDPQRQLALARKAVRRNLSVRQVEQLASETKTPRLEDEPKRIAATSHMKDVAQALSRATGLKVTLHAGKRKNSGRVVLYYNSLDEFDQLAEKLGAKPPTE
jgi:ParB family chromosome partitioning protein